MMHDTELLTAIANGDTDALEVFYNRYGLMLLNYLVKLVGERQLAEDVLQNVMVAVWRQAGAFRGDSQVKTWMFNIARYQAYHVLKRPIPETLEDHHAEAFPSEANRIDDRDMLRDALSQLPLEQREALELVFYRGWTLAESAAYLDIPLNTFKSRLHRAKLRLRAHLLREETDDPADKS